MYCPGCGTNNEIGARYCGVCGREFPAGAMRGSTAQHSAVSTNPAETLAGITETTTTAQPAGMTAGMQAAATNAAPVRTAASTTATSASTASDIVATVVSIAMMVAGKASDIAAIVAGVAAGVVTAAVATRPGRMAADIVHEAISLLPGRTGAGTAGTASTATAGTVTAGAPGTRQPRQRYRIRMPSEARQAELAAKGIPIDYPLRSTWLTGIGVAITLPSAILTSVCKDEITEELFYGSIDMMIGLAIIQCLIIMMLKAYRVRVIPILWASIYVFYTFLLCIFMILQSNVWPLITFLASIAILVGCCLRN